MVDVVWVLISRLSYLFTIIKVLRLKGHLEWLWTHKLGVLLRHHQWRVALHPSHEVVRLNVWHWY